MDIYESIANISKHSKNFHKPTNNFYNIPVLFDTLV